MRVLFVATIYRCGEKVYPIIKPLAERHDVDLMLMNQMHPDATWHGDHDPRPAFRKEYEPLVKNVIIGPKEGHIGSKGSQHCFQRVADLNSYDLIILDDNVHKKSRGFAQIRALAPDATIVGCPHGNHEFYRYGVKAQVPKIFDYSFTLGEKEKQRLSNKGTRHRFLPGGIPSNDRLKGMQCTASYILVVVSYVERFNTRSVNKLGYLPFNEKAFNRAGLLDVSQRLGVPILIKEKSRNKPGLDFSLKHLERKYDNVKVIMDVEDNHELVARSACLVSAPSSLCFAAIQLGIPTILLRSYGMIGNFDDWPGLVDASPTNVMRALNEQLKQQRNEAWLHANLTGAVDFNATDVYVEQIERLLEKRNE